MFSSQQDVYEKEIRVISIVYRILSLFLFSMQYAIRERRQKKTTRRMIHVLIAQGNALMNSEQINGSRNLNEGDLRTHRMEYMRIKVTKRDDI